MEFNGFSKKTLPFLSAIRANNNKEWFEAHKSEYRELILEPSLAFVIEMGEHLQALEPAINAVPKINGSLFRIYRDIRRMGVNKEPIKSRIGIIFWQGGLKRLQSSCFYLHFSPEELFVAVGIRWFEKPLLEAYREYILDEEKRVELDAILKDMLSYGYQILPHEYKRYPKGFHSHMPSADMSLYKGMAAYKVLDPQCIEEGEKLIAMLYEIYENMLPLQQKMYEISLKVKED
ncbi:DUF2461 domain-containing protein [bacterium]|nr:DUF2461 domain-containing protein [bacterium]MBU1993953.1 DUF2461 domain-containing protein [bacterium]